MGTQKTNIGGPSTGITINNTNKNGDIFEVGGRRMRKLSKEEIQKNMIESTIARGAETPLAPSAPSASENVAEEVANMIPEYIKNQQEQKESSDTNITDSDTLNPRTVAIIGDEIRKAKQMGDEETVNKLQNMLNRMLVEPVVEKKVTYKKTHPVLEKLKDNLGLQKIKPVTVEWAGFTWLFYPSNSVLDAWVAQLMGTHSFVALKICSLLVGLDGTPLYDILNVDIISTFEHKTDGDKVLDVPVYIKTCEVCGEILNVTVTECNRCGTSVDPFDMPVDLRLFCANEFHEWLVKNFGPYESLVTLLDLVQSKMKDRLADREELYPFLTSSSSNLNKTKS